MMNVRGKRALITGASHGMGFLVAQRLARLGAQVVLWDVSEDELAGAAGRIGATAWRVVDVGDRSAVAAAAGDLGPVDILVNNAGIVVGKAILDLTPDEIERTFRVNVLAHFWTIKAFLPAMIAADEGHIVTVASAAAICAVPRLADYSATKAAAVALDEALRLELRRARSRVLTTVVCPFYVATGMFMGVRTRWPRLLPILRPEYVAGRIVEAIRKGRRRLITPRTVALTFLARLLPVPWFDALASLLGVAASMDDFVGHAGAPAATGLRARHASIGRSLSSVSRPALAAKAPRQRS